MRGQFFDLMYANLGGWRFNEHRQYTFLRKWGKEALLVVANFDAAMVGVAINLPAHAFSFLDMPQLESHDATDLLTGSVERISFVPYRATETVVPGYGVKVLKITW